MNLFESREEEKRRTRALRVPGGLSTIGHSWGRFTQVINRLAFAGVPLRHWHWLPTRQSLTLTRVAISKSDPPWEFLPFFPSFPLFLSLLVCFLSCVAQFDISNSTPVRKSNRDREREREILAVKNYNNCHYLNILYISEIKKFFLFLAS